MERYRKRRKNALEPVNGGLLGLGEGLATPFAEPYTSFAKNYKRRKGNAMEPAPNGLLGVVGDLATYGQPKRKPKRRVKR